jgi:hypothetical protein
MKKLLSLCLVGGILAVSTIGCGPAATTAPVTPPKDKTVTVDKDKTEVKTDKDKTVTVDKDKTEVKTDKDAKAKDK